MIENVQLYAYGTAAILDLVLLLSMLERPNWPHIRVWMLALTTGVCLWHAGLFVYVLLANGVGPLALQAQWVCMTIMCLGLLVMPSAMLHGLHRYIECGIKPPARSNPFCCLYYLPVVLIFPISRQLGTDLTLPFLQLMKDYAGPYLAWSSLVNLIVAGGLWWLRSRMEYPRVRQFFQALTWTLVGITLFNILCMVWGVRAMPEASRWIQTCVAMSPVIPTIVFGYFVLRFRILPLMVERTLTYGAIVACVMLLHQVLTHDLANTVQDQFRVNFGLVEGVFAFGLILLYQPLRQRVSEAAQSLINSRVFERDQHRRLSVQLAAHPSENVTEIFQWFVQSARKNFRIAFIRGQLFNADGSLFGGCSAPEQDPGEPQFWLVEEMQHWHMTCCTRYDAPNLKVLEFLQSEDVVAILKFESPPRTGLLLIGARGFHQALQSEELSALALLVEQLAATLQNRQLQSERTIAERRATQHEKLSALGLMAGSIAHEVKNPLSSMKSIATVMAEELGPDSRHSEDLRLIIGEIDRLAQTTNQLLEIGRTPMTRSGGGDLRLAVERTQQLLNHLARQQQAEIHVVTEPGLPAVPVDDATLREIFFNLMMNAVEASGQGGRVHVRCRSVDGGIQVEVADNGPGLHEHVQKHLFEPLVTTKDSGTGLGLYVVSRRIQECGGRISCRSEPGVGTTFTIHLPVV
ncbi:two-component system sensor histidine kinase NtrB [Planctomicrobium sp. SH661]|uniref:sensor histidine kinase n=1 Tax=Planctomicrobium sp. SH661 TaxID=3448124 RepID=UPI003F5C2302